MHVCLPSWPFSVVTIEYVCLSSFSMVTCPEKSPTKACCVSWSYLSTESGLQRSLPDPVSSQREHSSRRILQAGGPGGEAVPPQHAAALRAHPAQALVMAGAHQPLALQGEDHGRHAVLVGCNDKNSFYDFSPALVQTESVGSDLRITEVSLQTTELQLNRKH